MPNCRHDAEDIVGFRQSGHSHWESLLAARSSLPFKREPSQNKFLEFRVDPRTLSEWRKIDRTPENMGLQGVQRVVAHNFPLSFPL
jgi:hypothetical protein